MFKDTRTLLAEKLAEAKEQVTYAKIAQDFANTTVSEAEEDVAELEGLVEALEV